MEHLHPLGGESRLRNEDNIETAAPWERVHGTFRHIVDGEMESRLRPFHSKLFMAQVSRGPTFRVSWGVGFGEVERRPKPLNPKP